MNFASIVKLIFTILMKAPDLLPVIKGLVEFIKWCIDQFKTIDEKFAVPATVGVEQKAKITEIKKASVDNAVLSKLETTYGLKATPVQAQKIREVIDKAVNPKYRTREFRGGRKP